jgi:hypothetical protein
VDILCDEKPAKFLPVVPDPNQATGREKVRRLRNLLMIDMMALDGLRTIEVQRANVEDLTLRARISSSRHAARSATGWCICGRTPGQIKEYVTLRGEMAPDADGTPLFSTISRHCHRLARECIRAQTVRCLQLAGLKRPGISNHALRHTAATLGYLLTGGLRAIDVVDNFPEECRYVLEKLGGVYHYDALAREQGLSPEDRLLFHQEHSGPLMKDLHEWMEAQLEEHKTEPNSGLGKAISYLLNHWPKLTLFLRQPGSPIDNNIVERSLKKAILNRKNALFYKTLNGAGVGDLFMSLIHTCELNGANPFDYLTELQRHAEELKQTPSEWMPWNYRETLAWLARPAAA